MFFSHLFFFWLYIVIIREILNLKQIKTKDLKMKVTAQEMKQLTVTLKDQDIDMDHKLASDNDKILYEALRKEWIEMVDWE
jgi:uncharacterized OsmC-like protein